MRDALLGLAVCFAIAFCATDPTSAQSFCRPATVGGGVLVDQFGRPCVDGRLVHDGLFAVPPGMVAPETLPPRRLPPQQPLPSFGFTTGSIGPFTTGPLTPFTTAPLAPAPPPHRGR